MNYDKMLFAIFCPVIGQENNLDVINIHTLHRHLRRCGIMSLQSKNKNNLPEPIEGKSQKVGGIKMLKKTIIKMMAVAMTAVTMIGVSTPMTVKAAYSGPDIAYKELKLEMGRDVKTNGNISIYSPYSYPNWCCHHSGILGYPQATQEQAAAVQRLTTNFGLDATQADYDLVKPHFTAKDWEKLRKKYGVHLVEGYGCLYTFDDKWCVGDGRNFYWEVDGWLYPKYESRAWEQPTIDNLTTCPWDD